MNFSDFQKEAATTDLNKNSLISILGLAGEIGSLYSIFKKRLRDKPPREQIAADLSEELGDLLWYIASIATQFDLQLSDIAEGNLRKTQEFFGPPVAPSYDDDFPSEEQLPKFLKVTFSVDDTGLAKMHYDGKPFGDALSDNSHVENNYKFHDAIHLAFLAHLHWSPNIRRILRRKRKSDPAIDENDDGARACAVEEAAAALVFDYARHNNFFEGDGDVPLALASLLMRMTSSFEVRSCSAAAWRSAIRDGARAFNFLQKNAGGVIEVDMTNSTIVWEANK